MYVMTSLTRARVAGGVHYIGSDQRGQPLPHVRGLDGVGVSPGRCSALAPRRPRRVRTGAPVPLGPRAPSREPHEPDRSLRARPRRRRQLRKTPRTGNSPYHDSMLDLKYRDSDDDSRVLQEPPRPRLPPPAQGHAPGRATSTHGSSSLKYSYICISATEYVVRLPCLDPSLFSPRDHRSPPLPRAAGHPFIAYEYILLKETFSARYNTKEGSS